MRKLRVYTHGTMPMQNSLKDCYTVRTKNKLQLSMQMWEIAKATTILFLTFIINCQCITYVPWAHMETDIPF